MNKIDPKNILSTMSLEEIKALREEATKKIHNVRHENSQRIPVYIQAEYQGKLKIAIKWAYENKLINKPTKWGFAKFALLNTIEMILEEIDKKKTKVKPEIYLEESEVEPEAETPQDMDQFIQNMFGLAQQKEEGIQHHIRPK